MAETGLMQQVEGWMEVAREQKRGAVRDAGEDGQFDPVITIIREGDPVAHVFIHNIDSSEKMAWYLRLATYAFRADATVLVFEGWMGKERLNPDTGKPWGENGMAKYVEKHGRGFAVGEGLIAFACDADMQTAHAEQEFVIDDREVLFLPIDAEMMKNAVADGYFVDELKDIYTKMPEQRKALQPVLDSLGPVPVEHMNAALDVMTVARMMKEEPVSVALGAEPNSEREFMLRALKGADLSSAQGLAKCSMEAKNMKAPASN